MEKNENIDTQKEKPSFTNSGTQQKNSVSIKSTDHDEVANRLIGWLEKKEGFDLIKAIGNRIVHGIKHTEPEIISPGLLKELKEISAETFASRDHLKQIIEEAQSINVALETKENTS